MPPVDPPEFLALQEALAGRYSIERELGRGGMGVVYLAHEVALDRPVALKLLPTAFAARPAQRERFLREARTAAKLSHPNIVPIFSVDEVGAFVFFAMAYVEGETLGQRLRMRGPLPTGEAARVLREVAWALAYAHARDVIHRDVKPDNILLEAGSGRALVTDFGIAQVRADPGLSDREEVLGTAEYMSPEQASGEPLDGRSDLYSLGVVGYYTLTGRIPFEAPTAAGVLAKHLTVPAPLVHSVAPEVPTSLGRAIDRCLRKAPEDRFQDGEALAEELGRAFLVQREVPIPLRVFIKQNREAYRLSGPAMVLLMFFTPSLLWLGAAGGPVGIAVLGAGGTVLLLLPLGTLVGRARRLLKAGYGLDDTCLALSRDVEHRREEIAFEYGTRVTLADHVFKWVMRASLLVTGGSVLSLLLLDPLRSPGPTWVAFGLSFTVFTASGIVVATRHERRRDVWGEGWLRFWKSRVGRWLFKLAGTSLGERRSVGPSTFRPTELAIGLAADRLFDQLPKTVRAAFPGLPDTIRRLEADAQVVRRRIEELDAILTALAEGDARPGTERRAALQADVQRRRAAAQQRLADAVSALETIRLDLLRLHAGSGTAESVTASLDAARDVSVEIARLAEGQAEVEALLDGTAAARRAGTSRR
jgi:predicted Ser/Thr protein kinase